MRLRRYFVRGDPRDLWTSRFWEFELRGRTVKTQFGMVARPGTTRSKTLASPEAARACVDKLVREKQASGFVDRTPPSWIEEDASPPPPKARPRAAAGRKRPFLFFGHGLGTSERCLECYLVFAKAPTRAQQTAIVAGLPPPLTRFARFEGGLLHFGSDDDLESAVLSTYGRRKADPVPTQSDWKRFCDDFERRVKALHRRQKLVAAVKPDSGEYGKALSSWHDDSVATAQQLAEHLIASVKKPGAAHAALTMNVLEDVVDSDDAASELPEAAQRAWRAWLDKLKGRGPAELQRQLKERRRWLGGGAR